ncbi:hypothetical protein GCM10027346_01620 [Hymenobacter seoulensis]
MKKLTRYLLPFLAATVLLKFLAYTPTVLEALTGPTSLFKGHFTAYNLGHTLGMLMRWVAFIGLAKLMWVYHRQWTQPHGTRLG